MLEESPAPGHGIDETSRQMLKQKANDRPACIFNCAALLQRRGSIFTLPSNEWNQLCFVRLVSRAQTEALLLQLQRHFTRIAGED